jgi:hypothetical protein
MNRFKECALLALIAISGSAQQPAFSQSARLLSPQLPFSETGWTVAKGAHFSTDGNANIAHCDDCSIQTLSLGKLNIPLKSTKISPDMVVETKDYGPLVLQINFAHGSFAVLVTAEQEAQFKKLCSAGRC